MIGLCCHYIVNNKNKTKKLEDKLDDDIPFQPRVFIKEIKVKIVSKSEQKRLAIQKANNKPKKVMTKDKSNYVLVFGSNKEEGYKYAPPF